MALPLDIEIGATNLEGCIIYLPDNVNKGPIHEKHIKIRRTLRSWGKKDVDNILLCLFEVIFDAAGELRPTYFNGFPEEILGIAPEV